MGAIEALATPAVLLVPTCGQCTRVVPQPVLRPQIHQNSAHADKTELVSAPQPIAELAGGYAEKQDNLITDAEVAASGAGKKTAGQSSGKPDNPVSLSQSEQDKAIKKAGKEYTGTDDIDARGIATKLESGIRRATE